MAKATWNGTVIAESDTYEELEGNIYFPPKSIKKEYFKKSKHTSTCFWKGKAKYYDIVVDGKTNENAAWYYPKPSKSAANIKNHVAFWCEVKVEK